MTHCPTCGAGYRGGTGCHRCRTDLSRVLAVEEVAADHRRRAMAALAHGRRREARARADRACALHRSFDSLAARAVVALAEGDFPLALRLWRETRRDGGNDEATDRPRACTAPFSPRDDAGEGRWS